MTLSILQLAQTVTGAVVTIVVLLLVAAVIGYFTAWFYAKSVYSPLIKSLEAEKKELGNQINSLKEEKAQLSSKIDHLNDKIVRLEEESAVKDKEIKKLSKSKKKQKMDV